MSRVDQLFSLKGRVALVTGASSWGIGSESAKLLADAGAKVFLTARREDKLQAMAESIEQAGGEAGYIACDVSSEEQCKAAVDACIERFGRLDIMVLSAGISGNSVHSIDEDFDTDNWRKVLGINLDGVIWMMKYGHAECAKNGAGSIIIISSMGAYTGTGNAPYTAAKGGLRSLTTRFGKQMAAEGVRVNTIYPGMIDSDMTHGAFGNPDYLPMFLPKIPLGRMGQPEDIANMSLFLASDASSWITGQHFLVDGGNICNY